MGIGICHSNRQFVQYVQVQISAKEDQQNFQSGMMNTSPVLAPKASNPKILPSINFFFGGGGEVWRWFWTCCRQERDEFPYPFPDSMCSLISTH